MVALQLRGVLILLIDILYDPCYRPFMQNIRPLQDNYTYTGIFVQKKVRFIFHTQNITGLRYIDDRLLVDYTKNTALGVSVDITDFQASLSKILASDPFTQY